MSARRSPVLIVSVALPAAACFTGGGATTSSAAPGETLAGRHVVGHDGGRMKAAITVTG